MAARAIIERLDCMAKLRYSEEFHGDTNNAMQFETNMITKKLLENNHKSIQNVYPTSNGRNRNYIYTKCGINPNDKTSINKLRAHLLSKQKQELDWKINKFHNNQQNKAIKDAQIMPKTQEKSLEIAGKLGFVPQFLKNTENGN